MEAITATARSTEFPTLSRDGIAYLDSSATSQTPQRVIDAMTRYYTEYRASVHRGIYPIAAEATDEFEDARRRAAEWLGWDAQTTVFTPNATAGPDMGVLIITHYQRILHLVQPTHVHVLFEGRIVKEGGSEIVEQLESKGYGWIREEVEAAV